MPDVKILWKKARPMTAPNVRYPGLNPRAEYLKKGSQRTLGSRALLCDLMWDVDVPVILRDGTKIFVDIFRPQDIPASGLPALVGWSPYGKQEGTDLLGDYPFRAGVEPHEVSDYQKWEGPDPAYWCAKGYVVVNPDARGVYGCGGDAVSWGSQEANDGYDVIEWIAAQPWCNGKVALTGNSWLAISQWFIAANRPPHLAAISPWEGFTDAHRHHLAIGGIPDPGFSNFIFDLLPGEGRVEDLSAMLKHYPLINEYWQSKSAAVERIEVPAYVVASWTNIVHTPGTFEGWSRLGSEQKWLRVHDTMEWSDYYKHEDDLCRFFDYFLKGKKNGWETTPKVRLAVLDPKRSGGKQVQADSYPLPANQSHVSALYLNATTATAAIEQAATSSTSYETGDGKGSFKFYYTFPHASVVLGAPRLVLYVSSSTSDTDVFVKVRPLTPGGKIRWVRTIPFKGWKAKLLTTLLRWSGKVEAGFLFYDGMRGRQRASHRAFYGEEAAARIANGTAQVQPLEPDEVVRLDIELTPLGMHFERGDMLEIEVGGYQMSPWPLAGIPKMPSANQGVVTLHTGENYPSCLHLPEVPLEFLRPKL